MMGQAENRFSGGFDSCQEAVEYIHSLHRFSRKPELTRMAMLMDKLGHPERKCRFIHVAGTNGKGSVSAFLAAMLRQAGYHVGLYTSPFIVDFRERIQLDGRMIPPEVLAQLAREVRMAGDQVAEELESPREFEFITAVALLYYSRTPCDVVVLEVGLGGRFDATNIIPPPLAVVIPSIGLDHTQLLGDTIEEIAFEKSGVIKGGHPVVVGPGMDPQALKVIRRRCRETGSPLVESTSAHLCRVVCDREGSRMRYRGMDLTLGLRGSYQTGNCMAAVDTALCLENQGLPVSVEAIKAGAKTAFLPARLEQMGCAPLVLLDGAHNPPGVAALRDSLMEMGARNIIAVVGMMADKNCQQALDQLTPFLKGCIVTAPPDNPRALEPQQLAVLAARCCSRLEVEPDCRRALDRALSLAGPEDTVLVFGSLYLASALRPALLELRDGGKDDGR
ncbi:folylpolyglutamate synthase/dihydrofolate synthase family protein [Angelakisella massiliensis]|uniref:bifunctional folylpolyglutamate synthase/dihydrofolate synthase n=1 Tax=Angelakisella massiliensis TaxID=1871018 RepID=UPI0024B1B07B|nr:folylpolyglutamate synthase/dihydrofolate synthase family protein [Angelakisella massiliensis]